MNPLLHVKLKFTPEKANPPGPRNLRSSAYTSVEKIESLIESLNAVLRYYSDNGCITSKMMIDVNYSDIIAKSNRVRNILKPDGVSTNDTIVGARFSNDNEGDEKHIITHYVDKKTVNNTLSELKIIKQFLLDKLSGKATSENFKEPGSKIDYTGYGLSKSKIRNIIIDCSVVDVFSVPNTSVIPERETFLITFYKSELSLSTILEKLEIDKYKTPYDVYGNDTISVSKELFDIINEKIPYMISMISSDLSQIKMEDIEKKENRDEYSIPRPQNEPTIGVIDTLFDETVYFHEWVDNTDYLDDLERMRNDLSDREHGTEVTSIIVDGPRLNPWLDDGCGRFKVRHFGVCSNRISTARLVKKIKEIIIANPDIHVWNLSMGTEDEVSKNFISYDAAALDELAASKNIVFIISGTNDNRSEKNGILRIGSPADSLNSIVVNSVRRNGRVAGYSRKGSVLSFYNKPDVSYYGGDYDEKIIAYAPYGTEGVYGTSFAAPWISRKMCYLIDVLGMPREIAKALIIDSAAGWDYKHLSSDAKSLMGYGIVPIDIKNVIEAKNDEIRFYVYSSSESYRTTNYAIPIPKDNENKYPFIARATLCYFPECSRFQGVDYTNRELSVQFGRINSKGTIDDINENVQDDENVGVDERQSRKDFRKWDNTKFISKVLKKNRPLKSYEDRLWGLVITSKERLSSGDRKGLNFGIVITLKEINGVNRAEDFIRACLIRGWIVNKIDVENQLNIYATAQEELEIE